MSIETGLPETPRINHPSNGDIITAADLPEAHCRWTPPRKAILVLAVRGGLIKEGELLSRYGILPEEFNEMSKLLDSHGLKGLRTTRADMYPVIIESLQQTEQVTDELSVGDTVLNRKDRTVKVGEKDVHLTGKEYSVLEMLMLKQGVVVSRETLMRYLYGEGNLSRPEIKILDVIVCRLRKKLYGSDGRKRIEGIWGRGYRLAQQEPT